MKTLRARLEKVLGGPEAAPSLGAPLVCEDEGIVLNLGERNELIDNIIKEIQEYVRAFEELECMLLELRPNSEFSFKSHPTENCTLIYSVKKE